MKILYEDNHLIAVRKRVGDIVQGDKTGDVPLSDMVKNFLKDKYQKPGNVYLGVVHRLDRPVSGVVLFAKTSKALPRLNKMFAEHKGVKKTYLAIVANKPSQPQGTLTHWLTRNEKQNTARAYDREVPGSKKAVLDYRLIAQSERYFLLEIELHTGRHHQIRCQLSKMGCPIRGDLKYGAPRSNPDGGISLHAWRLELEHPVSHQNIVIEAPLPEERLWQEIVPTHK
ncbi:MAG: RluA family pseudouridine synthase [Bacteroidaceae bacterium]|jgi:23S rRNA pseudouridine1911/1915/1917 synthase|nr:RluA family pseudouridine synthase [Bacteroidaceae bacterium]